MLVSGIRKFFSTLWVWFFFNSRLWVDILIVMSSDGERVGSVEPTSYYDPPHTAGLFARITDGICSFQSETRTYKLFEATYLYRTVSRTLITRRSGSRLLAAFGTAGNRFNK